MKKVLLTVLSLLMILSSLAACGEESSKSADETASVTASDSAAESEETATESPYPPLPQMDYDGYEFHFVTQEYIHQVHYGEMFIFAEALNGEPVNDSVYARNSAVEDKYNVKITEERMDSGTLLSAGRKSALSGDAAFDVLDLSMQSSSSLALEGLLYNFKNSDYIDLTAPYWDQNFTAQASPLGKTYMITGDLSLSALRGLTVFYYNIGLGKDLNLDDPYELMQKDQWVYDKYKEISIGASADLNGNGEIDESDRFGVGLLQLYYLEQGFGWHNVYLDETGSPYTDASKVIECGNYDDIFSFSNNKNYVLDNNVVKSGNDVYSQIRTVMFGNNQIMFIQSNLRQGEEARYLDMDYGVIPLPKLNEQQPRYYAWADVNWPVISVLFNNPDIERTCLLLEAMARESAPIRSAYYEQTLKEKYARSDYHYTAVDIVANSAYYDISCLYFPVQQKMIKAYASENPASAWEKIEESVGTELTKYLDIIKELD